MKRKIVHIDEVKCNGCGLCIDACHEGALRLIDNKARLVSESYCDGLGDCLPECPTGAIAIEEREAEPFYKKAAAPQPNLGMLNEGHVSQLKQWPCQLKLIPANAPYLEGADLLIAADCSAYAYAGIHRDFMQGKITLIGCPKLDSIDYSQKLSDILKLHNIKSLTVLKMEVPCCNGLAQAVKESLAVSGKPVPCQVITLSTNGKIIR